MSREIIYQAKVGLEGVTPLLHHKCANLGARGPIGPNEDYGDEWKETTYVGTHKKVVVPALCIEAMMIAASRNYKVGKYSMAKVMATGAVIQEFEVDLLWEGSKGEMFTIDDIAEREWTFTCPVVVSGKRVLRTRSCIPVGWYLGFTLDVLDTMLSEDVMRELFDRGGYIAGMLDWRPGSPKRPGKFGQFSLARFDVV